jgi:hypothetical protein
MIVQFKVNEIYTAYFDGDSDNTIEYQVAGRSDYYITFKGKFSQEIKKKIVIVDNIETIRLGVYIINALSLPQRDS